MLPYFMGYRNEAQDEGIQMTVFFALPIFLFFQAATIQAPATYSYPIGPITRSEYEFYLKVARPRESK